ncbi:MAG: hypothetical protein NWE92_12730 [Candidatus Bathyarchaeota archaeon]|nr:hypothetical protein [Candidatus Bathyarchaeota archaeon]
MTIRVVQQNTRVAEVRIICDICGKLIGTSLIPTAELESQKNKKMTCCNCKQQQ